MALVRSDLELKSDDDEEPEPPPALFWYPKEYVIDTWRQNRLHGTFPDGTYNSLDPQLRADWRTLTARYNHHFDQLRPTDNENGNRTSKRDSDVFAELADDSAGGWQEMMGD